MRRPDEVIGVSAGPSVCIGWNDLQPKVASTETCGFVFVLFFFFLNKRPESVWRLESKKHNKKMGGTNVLISECAFFPTQTTRQCENTPGVIERIRQTKKERGRAREREKETLLDSHSSPPTHLQPLFTQVCKCSFRSFHPRVQKNEKKKIPKKDRVSRDMKRRKSGQRRREKQDVRSPEGCEVPHVSLCSGICSPGFRCARLFRP